LIQRLKDCERGPREDRSRKLPKTSFQGHRQGGFCGMDPHPAVGVAVAGWALPDGGAYEHGPGLADRRRNFRIQVRKSRSGMMDFSSYRILLGAHCSAKPSLDKGRAMMLRASQQSCRDERGWMLYEHCIRSRESICTVNCRETVGYAAAGSLVGGANGHPARRTPIAGFVAGTREAILLLRGQLGRNEHVLIVGKVHHRARECLRLT